MSDYIPKSYRGLRDPIIYSEYSFFTRKEYELIVEFVKEAKRQPVAPSASVHSLPAHPPRRGLGLRPSGSSVVLHLVELRPTYFFF